MDQAKQFWIEFAEGRISVPEMLQRTEENPALLDWLTGIADPKFKTVVVHKETDEDGYSTFTPEELSFDAKLAIHVEINRGYGGMTGRYLNIHSLFSRIMITAFPDDGITMDRTLNDKFCFMLDACPEYIGGPEVDHLLDELLDTIPANLSKTKRVKLYKDQVKAMFHISGSKYPRWVQSAEWPISPSGKPMRFVEQKRKKGKEYAMTMYTHFIFEDVDTGAQRIIDQFT